MDPRRIIDESPMSWYQWRLVALCVILNILDGFDLVATAFTATSLSKEFNATGSQIGFVISAAFVGMAIGSIVLAPLGDRFGRRPVVLVAFSLCTAGPLLAAVAPSLLLFGVCRFVTGVGIGGALACGTVLVGEYSASRWRAMAISIYLVGTSFGMAGGGLVATLLSSAFGWRSVFLACGVASALFILALLAFLPESVSFLLMKRPSNALERVNRFIERSGHPPVAGLPPALVTTTTRSSSVSVLFDSTHRRSTVLLWIAFFMVMSTNYFATNWTPYLLEKSGVSGSESAAIGIMLPLGGMFGSILYGVLAARWQGRGLIITLVAATAFLVGVFSIYSGSVGLAYFLGILVGVLLAGSVTSLYSVPTHLYETNARNTGMGMALGVGRVGGIVAPVIAGALIDRSWSLASLGVLFAGCTAVAALSVLGMPRWRSSSAPTSAEDEPRSAKI